MTRKNIELYLSLFAVAISFIAAALTWWQVEIGREHNRMSVRPLINITPYLEGEGKRRGVYISNQGLGPAIITSIEVTVNGETFSGLGESQWKSVLSTAETIPLCYKSGWPIQGSVLRPGEEETLLAPTDAYLPICDIELVNFHFKKDVSISIGYESLYNEKFVAKGTTQINMDLIQ